LVDDYLPAKNSDGNPGNKFKATVKQTASFGEYSKNCQMKHISYSAPGSTTKAKSRSWGWKQNQKYPPPKASSTAYYLIFAAPKIKPFGTI